MIVDVLSEAESDPMKGRKGGYDSFMVSILIRFAVESQSDWNRGFEVRPMLKSNECEALPR